MLRALTGSINRYYDPTTDQFISIDPMVAKTDQPYAFVNDSPLNATDPLGLKIAGTGSAACNIQSGSNVRTTVCNGQSANGVSAAGVIITTPTIVRDVLVGIMTVSSTISIAGTNGVSVGNGGVTVSSGNTTATFGTNGSVSGSVGIPGAPNISIVSGGVSASSPTVALPDFGGHKITAQTTVNFYPWGEVPPGGFADVAIATVGVPVVVAIGIILWEAKPILCLPLGPVAFAGCAAAGGG